MLHVYHSNRLELLADQLCALLEAPARHPLEPENVVVQSTGMARWLALRIAVAQGVSANLQFPFPAAFIWECYQRVLGLENLPRHSQLRPDVLAWRLMDLLPEHSTQPGFEAVASYLEAGDDLSRYELGSRLADSYDAYLVYRPEWILEWERSPPLDAPWQARLWPQLRDGLGPHRVDLHRTFLERLESDARSGADLPARAFVFGISALAPSYLEALAAMAAHRELYCFVLNPCREYWGDIVSEQERSRRALGEEAAAAYLAVGHPLLASTGRQGRDFVELMDQLGGLRHECFQAPDGDHLLARLQRDILDLRDPTGSGEPPPAADDRSVQIHVCHGKLREIEILHDQLMRLLQDDPTLDAGAIVVMTPDIEDYAPYVEAVFGSREGAAGIPYTVADRAPLSDSPLLVAFFELLGVADGRLEVDRVMALLDHEPVRRKLRVTEADVERLREWVAGLAIRWGMNAAERERLGLPEIESGTWSAGLDRLLLGLATGAQPRPAPAALPPFPDVDGADADLIATLHSLIGAIQALREALIQSHPVPRWRELLIDALDQLLEPSPAQAAEAQALRAALAAMAADASVAGFDSPVGFATVRAALSRGLSVKAGHGGFLGGAVTFCAMVPMRSVPFDCLCLVGMNDGSYPRRHRLPGFDLMAGQPRRGDRSRREDDRYLFLEALLSARRYFYLSYVGRSVTDDSEIPPSPLVNELLDLISQGYGIGAASASSVVLVQHPLQAFSRRYFQGEPGLVSFSGELAEAVRSSDPRQAMPPLLAPPLPELADLLGELTLEDLIEFLLNPSRHLLRRRLSIELGGAESPLDPREPFTLDGLGAYALRQRMAELLPLGLNPDSLHATLEAEGLLGFGAPGRVAFDRELLLVEALLRRVQAAIGGDGRPLKVDLVVDLGGVTLQGRVQTTRHGGHLSWRVGRVRAADRLTAWVRHLALCAARAPGQQATAAVLGIDPGEDLWFRVAPDATRLLRDLVELYRQGAREPLPWLPAPGESYLSQLQKGRSVPQALEAATSTWSGRDHFPVREPDPHAGLIFGDLPALGAEFAALSERILAPMLDHSVAAGV